MLRFYGLGYRELMSLPVRAFWFMSHCIDRIQSAEDRRQFSVANNAQGGEKVAEYLESLEARIGKVYVVDAEHMVLNAERDEDGFQKLKLMAAGK